MLIYGPALPFQTGWMLIRNSSEQNRKRYFSIISLQFTKIIDLCIFFITVWLGGDTLLFSDNLDFSGTHSILYWAWSKWRNSTDEIPGTWANSLCLYMVNGMELLTFQGNPFYFSIILLKNIYSYLFGCAGLSCGMQDLELACKLLVAACGI